jgi:hypothetical protein
MLILALILYIVLSLIVAIAARTRHRLAFGWFILAILFSPVIAVLLLLALPKLEQGDGPVRLTRLTRIARSARLTQGEQRGLVRGLTFVLAVVFVAYIVAFGMPA